MDKKGSDTEMESTTSIPTTTNENKHVMTLPPPGFAMLTVEPESVEDVSPHVVATKKTHSPVKKAGHVYINDKSLSAWTEKKYTETICFDKRLTVNKPRQFPFHTGSFTVLSTMTKDIRSGG